MYRPNLECKEQVVHNKQKSFLDKNKVRIKDNKNNVSNIKTDCQKRENETIKKTIKCVFANAESLIGKFEEFESRVCNETGYYSYK